MAGLITDDAATDLKLIHDTSTGTIATTGDPKLITDKPSTDAKLIVTS